MLEQIMLVYQDYLNRCAQLERDRQPGDGLLGMGSGPDKDPCHDAFIQRLSQLLSEAVRGSPEDETRQILEYIYQIPTQYRDSRLAYWMLLAVHGLTIDLISRLRPCDAARLRTAYCGAYPRFERLPVQKKVLSALKVQSQ